MVIDTTTSNRTKLKAATTYLTQKEMDLVSAKAKSEQRNISNYLKSKILEVPSA